MSENDSKKTRKRFKNAFTTTIIMNKKCRINNQTNTKIERSRKWHQKGEGQMHDNRFVANKTTRNSKKQKDHVFIISCIKYLKRLMNVGTERTADPLDTFISWCDGCGVYIYRLFQF